MYKSKNLAAKVLSTLLIFITVISLINMEAPAASKT
ncbi:lipolytic enzyme, G-D-S-L, partial [Acetivibrio thermocellus YS]